MSTMEKDRVSNEVDSDDNSLSSEEPPKPAPRRTKKKSKSKRSKREQSGPLDSLPVGGDSVGGALGGVTNTLGGVTNNAVDQQKGDGGGKSDTLRLRLDLNLDIEIQLKARIHGDLELALLYVLPPRFTTSSSPLSHHPPISSPGRCILRGIPNLQHRVKEGRQLTASLSLQELRASSFSLALARACPSCTGNLWVSPVPPWSRERNGLGVFCRRYYGWDLIFTSRNTPNTVTYFLKCRASDLLSVPCPFPRWSASVVILTRS